MAPQELEERNSGDEMEEREQGQEQDGSENGGGDDRSLFPIALRGAALGAAGGAVVGAALAIGRALRPEEAEAVQEQVVGAGREIGTAAVRAAGGVLTAKPVSDLISGSKGSADRSETVKQAAREAGVAAASAAREAIASMREDSSQDSGQNGN